MKKREPLHHGKAGAQERAQACGYLAPGEGPIAVLIGAAEERDTAMPLSVGERWSGSAAARSARRIDAMLRHRERLLADDELMLLVASGVSSPALILRHLIRYKPVHRNSDGRRNERCSTAPAPRCL